MKNGEKDRSKIKTGSGTPVLGILGGMIQCVSETGIAQSLKQFRVRWEQKMCRIDGSNLPNVMKNADPRTWHISSL